MYFKVVTISGDFEAYFMFSSDVLYLICEIKNLTLKNRTDQYIIWYLIK